MASHQGKTELKILHTADIHLGDQSDRQIARRALAAVVDAAIAERVDLVIIAGDLFDSNREQDDVEFALGQLCRLPVPVVILPGNHDSYDETSIYRQVDFEGACPNVKLITDPDGEVVQFDDLDLTVWGRPVVDHHPEFRPIAGLPPREGERWHVGIAHGYHLPDGVPADRSSPIHTEEILESGWDYFALGHVHPYREVSQEPVISCYSGTPVRSSPLQQGVGAVVIVHLHEERGVFIERVAVDGRARETGRPT